MRASRLRAVGRLDHPLDALQLGHEERDARGERVLDQDAGRELDRRHAQRGGADRPARLGEHGVDADARSSVLLPDMLEPVTSRKVPAGPTLDVVRHPPAAGDQRMPERPGRERSSPCRDHRERPIGVVAAERRPGRPAPRASPSASSQPRTRGAHRPLPALEQPDACGSPTARAGAACGGGSSGACPTTPRGGAAGPSSGVPACPQAPAAADPPQRLRSRRPPSDDLHGLGVAPHLPLPRRAPLNVSSGARAGVAQHQVGHDADPEPAPRGGRRTGGEDRRDRGDGQQPAEPDETGAGEEPRSPSAHCRSRSVSEGTRGILRGAGRAPRSAARSRSLAPIPRPPPGAARSPPAAPAGGASAPGSPVPGGVCAVPRSWNSDARPNRSRSRASGPSTPATPSASGSGRRSHARSRRRSASSLRSRRAPARRCVAMIRSCAGSTAKNAASHATAAIHHPTAPVPARARITPRQTTNPANSPPRSSEKRNDTRASRRSSTANPALR